MAIAQSATAWLEKAFDNYVRPETDTYGPDPFEVRCIVSGRIDSPSPRDDRFEFIIDFGSGLIDKVLNKEPLQGELWFIFPDRWMQPAESQRFLSELKHNPTADKISRVWIVTNQPYIVGDCRKEEVRIITKEKE